MKNIILKYIGAGALLISLQSCVTNYTMSNTPTKTSVVNNRAKETLVPIKKQEKSVKVLKSSSYIDGVLAKVEKNVKSEEKKNQYQKSIQNLLNEAETFLGTPYRLGGMTRRGIDCSAFVLSVYGNSLGIELPRVSASQALQGETIAKENLKKGDLLFFSRGRGRISHVGIVYDITPEGEVKFIHSSSSQGVSITSLNNKYWAPKYRKAKRIIGESGEIYVNTNQNALAMKQNPNEKEVESL